MKFKDLNEANEEKLFVVKVTDLEYKGIEYVRTLNCSSAFPLTPLLKEALPVTKDEWERCALREKLAEKTFWKRLSWGSDEKPKYRCTLVKYIPNAEDLIPVYVQVTDKNFGLTDVKSYFKKAGIKVLVTEKGRYSLQYSRDFAYYSILYINESDLEKTEELVQNLKNHIDIGFAMPDRRVSASDKLTYK